MADKERLEYLVEGICDDYAATSFAVHERRTVDNFLDIVLGVHRALDDTRLGRSRSSVCSAQAEAAHIPNGSSRPHNNHVSTSSENVRTHIAHVPPDEQDAR